MSEKKTFLQKLKSIFNSNDDEFENASSVMQESNEFETYIEDIDPSSEGYKDIKEVVELSHKSLILVRNKFSLIAKNRTNERKKRDVRYFQYMTDDDVEYLKKIVKRYTMLTSDSTSLLYEISSFDSSVTNMEGKKDDAIAALPSIENAEKHQRILRTDIAMIEAERDEIVDEYYFMKDLLKYIKYFSYFLITMFVVSTLGLAYINVFNDVSIFYPTVVMIMLIMVFITVIYVSRTKITTELKRNVKKQNRAIELLNKKNAVMAYYTNFLNYEYSKYRVENSQMLKKAINDYSNYARLVNRKSSVRRVLIETEEELKVFFASKNIEYPAMSLQEFAKTLDIENKKGYYDSVVRDINKVDSEIEKIDQEQAAIWVRINELKDRDVTERQVISEIIKAYYHETDKIMRSYGEIINIEYEKPLEYDDYNDVVKDM